MTKNKELDIYWIFKDKYNEKWNPKILEDIRRYKAGEPIDYIIGWKPFLNCKIDLSLKPLIPRPETEYWIEQVIQEIKKRKGKNRKIEVLDIFAGSGCVGVAILKNTKNTTVDFAEIDPQLIKQIKINLKLNSATTKVKIIQSDVFESIKGKYDFILANPPYIRTQKSVQKNVLKYEPHLALFGRTKGLFYIKAFLKRAKRYLKPHGQIWMEFSPEQKNAIQKMAQRLNYGKVNFQKDQYQRWRYVVITKNI